MNIGQVGTKYAMDNLEAYKEGYENGRADDQKVIHKILNECLGNNDMAVVRISRYLYEKQIKEKNE